MKKFYILICSVIFFCVFDAAAQTGNMWTEIPFGQNLNCVHADGDYIYFGADFGIVKYNRLTGDKQYITFFNTLHDFIDGFDQFSLIQNFPETITSDSFGNLYTMINEYLYKYDGFVWDYLGYVSSGTNGGYYSLKFLDNKIWVSLNDNNAMTTAIVPAGYYDLVGDTMLEDIYTAINPYDALVVNNDGTLWTNDPNFYSGFGDSAHLVKVDLLGNILDDRYVYASFDYFGSYENFLISDQSGTLYYINSDGELSVNNGTSVSNYSMPTTNYFPLSEKFDSGGNLFILGENEQGGNFPPDRSHLFIFNGTAVTEYNDFQIGSPYHRFSDMDFDDDDNLWLTTYEHNNRSVEENVFKKTPANSWSRFYLNDVYLPGTHFPNYIPLGADGMGCAYFYNDNCISIVDSNLNTSFVQFYDSLSGNYNTNAFHNSCVSQDGAVWLINQNRLYKIQNGSSTFYTNFPASGTYGIGAVGNSKIFLGYNTPGSGQHSRIYSFDGSSWQLLPLTGLSNNTAIHPNFMTYDVVNDKLWYVANDTVTNQCLLVGWDGINNTVYDSTSLPWLHTFESIHADDDGNIWVINSFNSGDSLLVKSDGTNSYYYIPPYGIYFDYGNNLLLSASGGHLIFKQQYYYNQYNGTESEAIVDFDGTNWNVTIVPDNVNFYAGYFNFNYDQFSLCVAANGKYLFTLANEIAVYDPNGIPNMPGATYNFASGNIYYDMNANNLFDAGDLESQGIAAVSDNYSALSNWFGDFELHTDTGMQNIHSVTPPYYIAAPANYTHNFHDSVSLGINHIDFALQPIPGINDLTVDVSHWGFRPGHDGYYYLNYKNAGTTIQNGTLTLIYDNQLNYSWSSTAPSSINGNTISWNLGSLSPFDQGMIYVSMFVDSSIAIGTPLNSVIQITPVANDTTPLNNLVNYSHAVVASWDPNKKTVTPEGVGSANIIDTTQELTYSIFFQNTGTDTAFNITVFDTLDANVDVSTFKIISSSHPVQFYFQNPDILKFVFSNILLPDSTINEPGSHGFVKYSIKPKSGTQYGDTIQNTGYIYFDYNSPVVTNTTLNTLGDPLSVFELSNGNQLHLSLYPNPNSGKFEIEIASALSFQNLKLEITDCAGRILKSNSFISNKTAVNCANFSAGVYFVKVLSGDKILGTAKYVLMK